MGKQILVSLILLSSFLSSNAQIYVPNGTIQGSSGNNNVGIGVTNPVYKLMVQGEIHINRDYPYLQFNSSYWNAGSYIQTGVTTSGLANGDFMTFYNPTSKGFNFCQGSYSALTINQNGKIGIGTTNPQTMLNVNVGSGGSNGIAGIRIGGFANYESLEFGIDGDYDGMIRSYGNNIKYYAGHWKLIGTTASENHSHMWYTSKAGSTDWSTIKMILNQDGNLGIGTTLPAYKLDVCGTIRAKEVKVDLQGSCGADFVFKSDYKLMDLKRLEEFVKTNSHLPEIATEKEMVENGVNIKEFQIRLLQKIEELTLYTIEQNKRIVELEKQNAKIQALENEINELKK
jgi:hypothetical protein